MLTSYIVAARESLEQYCNRPFADGSYLMEYDALPADNQYTSHAGFFRLPFTNISSVDSIGYINKDGVDTTIDGADYAFNPARGIIYASDTWPDDGSGKGVIVTVSVTADVPNSIVQAIKLRASDMYEHRTEQIVGKSFDQNKALVALANPYRASMGV